MQISELNNKVNQISKTWEEFKQVNDRKLAEIEKKGSTDPLNEEQLRKINDSISEQKQRLNKMEALVSRPGVGAKTNIENDRHHNDFLQYVRKGVDLGLSKYETKSLSVGSNQDGGYLVADTISKQIVKRVAEQSVMRSIASIETISTDSLDIIIDSDKFASGWVTETANRPVTLSAQVQKQKIYTHEMYAQPKATQKLIDDASIDIGKWIVEKVSESFIATENQSFLHGDGENKPKGIFAYEEIDTNHVNKGDNLMDKIIEFTYSLNTAYAANGKFLMHRNMIQKLRGLRSKEAGGQYLWAPSIAAGRPDTLLGAEIIECNEMPLPGSDKASIVFGDFSSAYKIVDRHDIRVLRDPFTEKPFVKFYATKRVGGSVVNPAAIKFLSIA
ncbi:MAG: phage major capsid protein [Rickettsiales bacterium]